MFQFMRTVLSIQHPYSHKPGNQIISIKATSHINIENRDSIKRSTIMTWRVSEELSAKLNVTTSLVRHDRKQHCSITWLLYSHETNIHVKKKTCGTLIYINDSVAFLRRQLQKKTKSYLVLAYEDHKTIHYAQHQL